MSFGQHVTPSPRLIGNWSLRPHRNLSRFDMYRFEGLGFKQEGLEKSDRHSKLTPLHSRLSSANNKQQSRCSSKKSTTSVAVQERMPSGRSRRYAVVRCWTVIVWSGGQEQCCCLSESSLDQCLGGCLGGHTLVLWQADNIEMRSSSCSQDV